MIQNIQKNSRGGQGDSEAAGKAFFLMGESLFRQFSAIPDTELEKKVGLVDQLTQAYTGAAQLGTGEEAVGALYRIGLIYQAVASALEKTPIPPGLTAEQTSQVQAQIQQQAGPLKQQADEAFTTCLRKSRGQICRSSPPTCHRLPAEGAGSRRSCRRRASRPVRSTLPGGDRAAGPAGEDAG